jgi:hypothetical protein
MRDGGAPLAVDVPAAGQPGGDPVAAPLPAGAAAMPREAGMYRRSWLDWLIDALEGLPGLTWVAYAILITIGLAVSNLQYWLSDLAPAGELSVLGTFWGIYPFALVVAYHVGRGIARAAFDTFRPLLDADDAEAAGLRHRLTVIPARPATVITVVIMVTTPLYYAADPVGSQVVGYTAPSLVLRYLGELLTSLILVLWAYQAFRQIRLINRVVGRAGSVDLFQPERLGAFARLTSYTAIAFVLFSASTLLVTPVAVGTDGLWIVWAGWYAGIAAVAMAVFVLPLMGLHERLAAEKTHLQADCDMRVRTLFEELNEHVDRRDVAAADGTSKLLSSILAQRDVLGRLSTWPWSTGALRALVSAILLPIGLFVAQRLLGQFLQ